MLDGWRMNGIMHDAMRLACANISSSPVHCCSSSTPLGSVVFFKSIVRFVRNVGALVSVAIGKLASYINQTNGRSNNNCMVVYGVW